MLSSSNFKVAAKQNSALSTAVDSDRVKSASDPMVDGGAMSPVDVTQAPAQSVAWEPVGAVVTPIAAGAAIDMGTLAEAFVLAEATGRGPHWCHRLVPIPAGNRLEAKLVVQTVDAEAIRVRLQMDDWTDNAWVVFGDPEASRIAAPTFDATFIAPDLVHLRIMVPACTEDRALDFGLVLLSGLESADYEGKGRSVCIEEFSFTIISEGPPPADSKSTSVIDEVAPTKFLDQINKNNTTLSDLIKRLILL